MAEQTTLIIYDEITFLVSEDTFLESTTENDTTVIFEDNGETGYFYAVDYNNEMTVLDALHIYNVKDVVEKDKPNSLKILWTQDRSKAFLSINNYYHAVFDFQKKAGYCRNGFPEKNGSWTLVEERKLTDALLDQLSLV